MRVTNETTWPFLGIGHRRLWPNKRSQILWPNNLVTSNLTRPRQIQRGRADVAKLWPNEIITDQNQPGPVQPSKWAKPNNSAHSPIFSCLFYARTWAKPSNWAFLFFGPWPFAVHLISVFGLILDNGRQVGPNCQLLLDGGSQSSGLKNSENVNNH